MYAYIINGQVDREPQPLPGSWENVSNLEALSDDELRDLGWYPVVDEEVPYSDTTLPVDLVVGPQSVTRRVRAAAPPTEEELAAQAEREVEDKRAEALAKKDKLSADETAEAVQLLLRRTIAT